MQGFYFSASKPDGYTLCLSPITNRILDESSQEVEDQSGYFLYEMLNDAGRRVVNILAQVHTDDAALRMRDMLGLT